ncbi:5-methylcytosine restriction system specificity protein McrC [Alloprevotella tannerae]|uniref:5-methylcytosine restriction system specificity protein McrC n=1 Tax=Alloprevotella tannerae TaxID=76122 RepID=UPI0028D4B756|nr:TonB-dependent receptor [Alloprevotella tannerae]
MSVIRLQEHEQLPVSKKEDKYDRLKLVKWRKDNSPEAYYASYKIGAEWIDEQESLIVTTKHKMEQIDFVRMFMTCFTSDLSLASFSTIYKIYIDKPSIKAPALQSVVSPLLVLHFLGVVSRIKELKKGYVSRSENLKKVKGRISILKNERQNIAIRRYDRVFCEYDEYSADIPENRLIKKALLFSQRLLQGLNERSAAVAKLRLNKSLALFSEVSDKVEIKQVKRLRAHKLFTNYNEAIRLAKLILRLFDYNISKVGSHEGKVVPFWLDMSLLYEHYVYGLLHEAYRERITYQFKGEMGIPDFLYKSEEYKAILDTKYIPKYEGESLDKDVVRQLSGYGRDLRILTHLEYKDASPIPCIIIYPKEGRRKNNPFLGNNLRMLCGESLKDFLEFYKIEVSLPTIR